MSENVKQILLLLLVIFLIVIAYLILGDTLKNKLEEKNKLKNAKNNIKEIKNNIKDLNINHSYLEVFKYNIDLILILPIFTVIISLITKYCTNKIFIIFIDIFLVISTYICTFRCVYKNNNKSIKFNRGHIVLAIFIALLASFCFPFTYLDNSHNKFYILVLFSNLIGLFVTLYISIQSVFSVYLRENTLIIKTKFRKVKIELNNLVNVYTDTEVFYRNHTHMRCTYFNIIYKNKNNKNKKFKKCIKIEDTDCDGKNSTTRTIIVTQDDINSIKNCFVIDNEN